MPFKETKTLINTDSDIRIDLETLARIEFSDVEYLLSKIGKGKIDSRIESILYESAISKVASIFQLAIRAYKYLEKPELKEDLIKAFSKSENTSTGKIGKYREDLFHNGIHFFEKTIFYPFGIFKGRGFKAIHIKKGARFNIKNVWVFESENSEYSITSEGVYKIDNIGTLEEKWSKIEAFPTISAVNFDEIIKVIKESIGELKIVWFNISKILDEGDGNHKYQFLNENGNCELLEKINGEIISTNLNSKLLIIEGNLTIAPPDQITVENNSIKYH